MADIILNPSEDRWNDFIAGRPDAMIFHAPEWQKVLEKTLGFTPFNLAMTDGGRIVSVLPLQEVSSFLTGKRLVSIPYSACADCLGGAGSEGVFVDYLAETYPDGRYGYTQLRSRRPLDLGGRNFAEDRRFVDCDLDLKGTVDTMWKGYKARIRTAVRKAGKNGVRLVQGDGKTERKAFYHLMLQARKRFGTPPFAPLFYNTIVDSFPGTRFMLAEFRGKMIAVVMLIPWQNTMYYFFAAADVRHRSVCAADFLVWEIIKDAYAGNAGRINFGRSEKDNTNLLSFKTKWGAREIPLYYYSLPDTGGVSDRTGFKYRAVVTAFRKMPAGVSRLIGPFFTRHLG